MPATTLPKKSIRLKVLLTTGEDGYLVAEIPVIPGCISQGKTRAEALKNIREAATLCLEGMKEEGWRLPEPYDIDEVEVPF